MSRPTAWYTVDWPIPRVRRASAASAMVLARPAVAKYSQIARRCRVSAIRRTGMV